MGGGLAPSGLAAGGLAPGGLADALLEMARMPLAAFGLGLSRCLGLLMILPISTRLGLTGMHRAGVAAALALLTMPMLAGQLTPADVTGGHMILLTAKESLIGFLLGLLFAVPFWAAETAGELLDQQRGSRGAVTPDPISEAESGVTATLMVLTLSTLFLSLGGMHWLVGGIMQSYLIWPVNMLVPALRPGAGEALLHMLDGVLGSGLILAGPLLIAMILAELGLALVSRFAPQLNVFDLAMSLKGLVMVIGLPIYAVFLIGYLRDSLAPLQDMTPVFHLLSGR